MAKSKSFFGLRKGSTKTLTFAVLDGVQITKDRVVGGANPRTDRQMIQRIIMNTCLRAYSGMISIVDHSLEGISYGGKTQREWMSINLKNMRTRIAAEGADYAESRAFVPVGRTFIAGNEYLMSQGSLPSVEVSAGETLEFKAGTTYADVIAALGLQAGDQLTFCMIVDGLIPEQNHFEFCRVILQPQDAEGRNLDLSTPFIGEDEHINAPNKRNEFTADWTFVSQGNDVLAVYHKNMNASAGTIIVSREKAGKWLRSTQYMVCRANKGDYTLSQALDMTGVSIDVTDPMFLNGATQSSNVVAAEVTAIKANGSILANGEALTGNQTVIITGKGLTKSTVKLSMNDVPFEPVAASSTQQSYSIQSNGTLKIVVNGEIMLTATVSGAVASVNVSKMTVGGRTVSVGANAGEFAINAAQQVTVEGSGFTGKEITVSNSKFTVNNKSITDTAISFSIVCDSYNESCSVSLDNTVLFACKTAEEQAYIPPAV